MKYLGGGEKRDTHTHENDVTLFTRDDFDMFHRL